MFPAASNARTVSVYVPFVSVVVSSVQVAGLVAETERSTLFSRNSMRVAFPVAVARKVTSPENGLEPESGATDDFRPYGCIGRMCLEVVEGQRARHCRGASHSRLAIAPDRAVLLLQSEIGCVGPRPIGREPLLRVSSVGEDA